MSDSTPTNIQLPPLYVKLVHENAQVPKRATTGSAGYDLTACEATIVPAHGKAIVKTGIQIQVPENHYGRIAPRSSLAVKSFIDVGAGVVDSDYRGEVGVVLFNHSDIDFVVNPGDRVAQLIIERIALPEIVEVNDLPDSQRGEGGFGSTGK